MASYYPAIIEKAEDGFGVFFPDLPGCISFGVTQQEAARNAEEAVQGHLEVSAEHGDAIPAPTELDRLPASYPEVREVARILVRRDLPSPAVRVNVTMPKDLLAAVDRYAERHGYTRSGLLAQAVRERMASQRRR